MSTVQDVACTCCGCVCDDLRLTVQDGRIVGAEGACHLSERWFLGQDSRSPPAAAVEGRPVPLDVAVRKAGDILAGARWPLIYGLSRSSTEGQRAAVALAEAVGANIDTTASLCHAPSILAIQEVGESTCTLGEVRNRADLVLFWGVDPPRSHPRHFERYSVDPPGLFVPDGRGGRTVVVLNAGPGESDPRADLSLVIPAGRDFEVLWALRALVGGRKVAPEAVAGLPLETLSDLTRRLKGCRCGVVFFGLGLARGGLGHRTVEALLRLVTELNAFTRFYARRMRVPGDVAGADSVLCWQTGYPFSVNLSRGYPRYNPGEFSGNELLERGEADACLLVGSEGVAAMSPRAVDHLSRIPTIALDHPTVESVPAPTVRFTTAVYGIHLPGTAYRMDEVPVPLRAVLPATYPSDADVLNRILRATGQS